MNAKREPEDRSQASWQGFLGDLSQLAGRLGESGEESLPERSGGILFDGEEIVDSVSLVRFLEDYRVRFIIPIELPTIIEASRCVINGEFRELMALDHELSKDSTLKGFSEASRWVGQCHARPMRGMRDHRVVWRYCDAIRLGAANGWHSVVYGVVLAAFSIPLRQGLVNYCERIVGGFVESAATKLDIAGSDAIVLQERLMEQLVNDIDASVGLDLSSQLRIS